MQSGFTGQIAIYGTIGFMVLQTVFNALGSLLIDRCGRRHLLLWGNVACIIATSLRVLTTVVAQRGVCPNCQYGSLVVLLLFIMIFNLASISVPLILQSEMFPKAAKESAVTVSVGFLHGSATLVGIVFPFMQHAFKEWPFIFFSGAYGICTIYLWFTLIETKGRTFEEIQADLVKRHVKRPKYIPQQSELIQRHAIHGLDNKYWRSGNPTLLCGTSKPKPPYNWLWRADNPVNSRKNRKKTW